MTRPKMVKDKVSLLDSVGFQKVKKFFKVDFNGLFVMSETCRSCYQSTIMNFPADKNFFFASA